MTQRPKVLVTTPDFPPAIGGIQRLLGELVSHTTGWETRVVTLDHPYAGDAPMPVPTRRVSNPQAFRRASIAQLNLLTLSTGLAWRPDAIISGHIVTSPGAIMLGRLLQIPSLQFIYAKELTDHDRLGRFALARATATIVLSEHTAQIARDAGADPARLHLIAPGVDVVGRAHEDQSEMPTILTVARLNDRYKGFDVMLRAMPLVRARIPTVRWVVVGEGPLRDELEGSAKAWALEEHVLFCGHVSDGELDRWFARSHVFAMPSRLPANGGGEGYGLVYLEAGARSLPCVAGNAGAVAEAVIDGVTGLLVDPTDHVATAAALVELLADPERAAALGAAGCERAHAHSWDRMSAALETLVAGLMAAPK